jgi:hypothetical protein
MSEVQDNIFQLPQRGRGGARQGAGRPVGIPQPRNHAARSLRNEALTWRNKFKKMPVELLLEIINTPLPEGDTAKIIAARKKLKADQLEAAKAAAPFCHYRIAAVTIEPEQAASPAALDVSGFADDELAEFKRLLLKAQMNDYSRAMRY